MQIQVWLVRQFKNGRFNRGFLLSSSVEAFALTQKLATENRLTRESFNQDGTGYVCNDGLDGKYWFDDMVLITKERDG